jgi:hypothetical protein
MTGKQLVGVWLHKPDATNRSRNVADRIVGVDMPVTIDECGAEQSRKWKRRNERSVRHIAHGLRVRLTYYSACSFRWFIVLKALFAGLL